MSEILETFTYIIGFAFAAIPRGWFLLVLPVMVFLGIITVVRRL